jgi:hypothetical protein
MAQKQRRIRFRCSPLPGPAPVCGLRGMHPIRFPNCRRGPRAPCLTAGRQGQGLQKLKNCPLTRRIYYITSMAKFKYTFTTANSVTLAEFSLFAKFMFKRGK